MAGPIVNIDDIVSNMFTKFDNFTQCILLNSNKVTESIDYFKSFVCDELKNICTKLNEIKLEVSVLQDRIDLLEREKNNNDIVISGVPLLNNISLHNIVMDICKAISIEDGPSIVNNIFRVNQSNSDTPKSPTIVVKFVNWQAKNRFFKSYLKHGNLNLSHIGLQTKSRIYCNCGLTKMNSSIFNYAKHLQKQAILSKVISKKGKIHILQPNKSSFLLIKSIKQLNDILAENQPKIQVQHGLSLNDSNRTNFVNEVVDIQVPTTSTNYNCHISKEFNSISLLKPAPCNIMDNLCLPTQSSSTTSLTLVSTTPKLSAIDQSTENTIPPVPVQISSNTRNLRSMSCRTTRSSTTK